MDRPPNGDEIVAFSVGAGGHTATNAAARASIEDSRFESTVRVFAIKRRLGVTLRRRRDSRSILEAMSVVVGCPVIIPRHHPRASAADVRGARRVRGDAPRVGARARPAPASTRDLIVVHGKKKGGFAAEMMGGGDENAATTKKAAASKGTASPKPDEVCPCGGYPIPGLPYARCCKPYHKGDAYPGDCVTLMRSRFSGYAKGEGDYIVKTTHPENPIFKDGSKAESGKVVSSLADDVKMTCKKVRFYGLEIVQDKGKGEDEHYVGFKYKCRVVGQKGFKELAEESHSELSTFRRGEDGRWLFLDGVTGAVE